MHASPLLPATVSASKCAEIHTKPPMQCVSSKTSSHTQYSGRQKVLPGIPVQYPRAAGVTALEPGPTIRSPALSNSRLRLRLLLRRYVCLLIKSSGLQRSIKPVSPSWSCLHPKPPVVVNAGQTLACSGSGACEEPAVFRCSQVCHSEGPPTTPAVPGYISIIYKGLRHRNGAWHPRHPHKVRSVRRKGQPSHTEAASLHAH